MKTAVIGSNPRIVNFYCAFIEMVGGIGEPYNSISVGIKRAGIDKNIVNIIVVIENREDYLVYTRLKDTIDMYSKNVFVVCVDESLMAQVTGSKTITMNHRSITMDFANILSGAGA